MRRTLLALLAALVVLVPGATARAQGDSNMMSVKVPFAFKIGEKAMAAGDYDVELSRVSKQVIFRPAGTKRQPDNPSGQILTHLAATGQQKTLVFDRRGDVNLLSEVWFKQDGYLIQGDYGDIDHQHRMVKAHKPAVASASAKQ